MLSRSLIGLAKRLFPVRIVLIDRGQDQEKYYWQEPHDDKEQDREAFVETSSVEDFHNHEWKHDEKADERWNLESCQVRLHNISLS
jgi:hypothetical protein